MAIDPNNPNPDDDKDPKDPKDPNPDPDNPNPDDNPDPEDLKVKYSPEELTRRLMNTTDEAKKYRLKLNDERKKRQELEDKLKEQEKATLAEQGKWKERSEVLEKELEEERISRKKDRESYATEGVISVVQREAMKMGVTDETDLQDLIALAPWNELDVDDNFKPKTEDVKAMLLEQKKLRPRLFSTKKLDIHDGNPGSKGGQKPGDRAQYLKELREAKTQKEFDSVRKKYGHVGL